MDRTINVLEGKAELHCKYFGEVCVGLYLMHGGALGTRTMKF